MAQIPSVGSAREAARTSILKAKHGTNPVEERRAEKTRREIERVQAVELAEGRFELVAFRFLHEHIERKCSSGYAGEVRRILDHDVFAALGQPTDPRDHKNRRQRPP
jgi:hypothetical protein